MKQKRIAGIAMVATLLMTVMMSCEDCRTPVIKGRGPTVEADLIMDPFEGFVLAIAANVEITQGDEQRVTVKAQSNIIDNLCLDVVKGSWVIRYEVPVLHAQPVTIYITVPSLNQIGLSGSGNIIGTNPFTTSTKLDIAVSGSGNVELETVNEIMNVLISGSGDVNLKGETDDCDLWISGSGNINAFDFDTRIAMVTISGSGNTYLSVTEFLKVLISGSGSVHYRNSPEIEVSISGSGRVIKDFTTLTD